MNLCDKCQQTEDVETFEVCTSPRSWGSPAEYDTVRLCGDCQRLEEYLNSPDAREDARERYAAEEEGY